MRKWDCSAWLGHADPRRNGSSGQLQLPPRHAVTPANGASYILFVSTIEAQNHTLLFRAWRRCWMSFRRASADTCPAGRIGWLVDDLMRQSPIPTISMESW